MILHQVTAFNIKKHFQTATVSWLNGQEKRCQMEDMQLPKDYDRDFEYLMKNTMICLKQKKEFVAARDQQVYSTRDPLKLLKVLNMKIFVQLFFQR